LIKFLPPAAVKVLHTTSEGLVRVAENVASEDAFYEIGEEFAPGCNIVVEDRLAKLLLEEVAKKKGAAFAANIHIRFGPGGDSAMKKDAAVYIKHPDSAPVLIFDGDKVQNHQDPATLTVADLNPARLDEIIEQQTGMSIKFAEDSNMSLEQKRELRIAYLKYYRRKVFYLPFQAPEHALWDDQAAAVHLNATLPAEHANEVLEQLAAEKDAKKKFAKLANALGQLDIASVHAMFVTRFVSRRHDLCASLEQLLNDAVIAVGNSHA
jgi:hypothetical protein